MMSDDIFSTNIEHEHYKTQFCPLEALARPGTLCWRGRGGGIVDVNHGVSDVQHRMVTMMFSKIVTKMLVVMMVMTMMMVAMIVVAMVAMIVLMECLMVLNF